MVHTSHPIGAATAGKYYQEHYASSEGNYYTQGHSLEGHWHGALAAELGLKGAVRGEAFERLVNGQDPNTGEQRIKHRDTKLTAAGKELPHRAAWDMVFQPDKSVSLTALVGGDERVRLAHRQAVQAALDAGEMYTQAKGGGNKPAITTGKWIVSVFEHDTARPERVDENNQNSLLYPSPHLHSHAVLLNFTTDAKGKARALETGELFKIQMLLKSVYQSELKHQLRNLGYRIREGKNGAAEIAGYTKEYLDAESIRSQRIQAKMEELGLSGRRAEEIVAHQGRNEKLTLTPEEVRTLHLARAAEFGNQPQQVVEKAKARGYQRDTHPEVSAAEAVSFAKATVSERLAVFDHFRLVSEALRYGRGHVRVKDAEKNIAERAAGPRPEFIAVQHARPNSPGLQYTTREMVGMERQVLELTGQGRGVLAPIQSVSEAKIREQYQHLNNGRGMNADQARASAVLLQSRDKITGLQGDAGTGKTTTTLRVVTETAKKEGMEVIGLAPTGRARKELEAAGIPAQTLQRFLIRNEPAGEKARLFIVDESSLVSTAQYRDLLTRLQQRPQDRIIEVGDIKQHESVEAARIFHEQQLGGMETASLTRIVSQSDPELQAVVAELQAERPAHALALLKTQGRVTTTEKRGDRLEQIARDFAAAPDGALVISPDNASRQELNTLIRGKLQAEGTIAPDTLTATVQVVRQELSKEDAKLAASYEIDNVVQFIKGSKTLGVKAGEQVRVIDRDTEANTITVKTATGIQTYNPKDHHGVGIFERQLRPVATGEQIVFKAPWKEKGIANGDAAVLQSLDRQGNAKATLTSGRTLLWNLRDMQRFDYGYASTSYGSQGATYNRVLIHMDTSERGAKQILSGAMAYVAMTRPREELRVFTDDEDRLERMLGNSEVKKMGLSPEQVQAYNNNQI
jgi:conjugative relaxase-like TrwC/TraI family protein